MIVAVTGVILILFVIGHLLGNLQIFLGPDWINGYAEHLRELGPLLWIIRGLLLIDVLAVRVVAPGAAIAVSLPDIVRYLKMRSM